MINHAYSRILNIVVFISVVKLWLLDPDVIITHVNIRCVHMTAAVNCAFSV